MKFFTTAVGSVVQFIGAGSSNRNSGNRHHSQQPCAIPVIQPLADVPVQRGEEKRLLNIEEAARLVG
jgi:hypothetical protein